MKQVTLVEYSDCEVDHSKEEYVILKHSDGIVEEIEVLDLENQLIREEWMYRTTRVLLDTEEWQEDQYILRLTMEDMRSLLESHKENWEDEV